MGRLERRGVSHGVTLVELLVVISILVLLAAITVPSFQTGIGHRRVQESARLVEQYILHTRSAAMASKHPLGVQLVRWDNQPEVSVQLRRVEVPEVYVGADESARFTVQMTVAESVSLVSSPYAIHVDIQPGDEIQFGQHGWRPGAPVYRIDSIATNDTTGVTTAQATLETARNGSIVSSFLRRPWSDTAPSSPQLFAIKRQPVPASMTSPVAPLNLPQGTCIDLCESGNGLNLLLGTDPITIVFNAKGTVEQVLGAGNLSPVEPLYLLVAHLERVPLAAAAPRGEPATESPDPQGVDVDPGNPEKRLRAWRDGDSRWVGVDLKSGRVVSAEVAYVDQRDMPTTLQPGWPFSYAAVNSYGQRTHLLWGLRKSRALAWN